MAKFAGSWKFSERSNNEKILEIMGVPKEKMGAMLAGVESASTECTWDAANNHLVITNKAAGFKHDANIKMGASFPPGPYAPDWKCTIHVLEDSLIKAKVFDPQGNEVGTWESKLEGDKMTSTSVVKGETSKISWTKA